MARGYLSGVIVGTLVSGLGLGTASVLTSPGQIPAPQAGQVDVPTGSGFSQSRDDTAAALPGADQATGLGAGSAPDVSAPEPDDIAAIDDEATQSAAQPETGQADTGMTAPADGAGAAGVTVDSVDPVLPSQQSQAPEAPAGEEDLSISTDPAQPAMPNVDGEDAAFPADDVTASSDDAQDGSVDEAMAETETEAEVEAEVEPAAEAESDEGAMSEDVAGEAATQDAVSSEDRSGSEDTTIAQTEPEQDESSTEQAVMEIAAAEPSSTIDDLAPEVKTNRLPSVGSDPAEEGTDETEIVDDVVLETEPEEDTRSALELHAEPFDNPDNKPLMSIILIDDGSSPVGLQALESFPYPLSFAVPASWEGAEDAMIRYRSAGFEVLALTDLPAGAGAKDAEQAMQAIFSALPKVVGVMEGTGSGLQSSRAAAEQLAPILLESGHGVVLFPKGLNTAQKLLAREGVPSAPVFRDFDAKGQSATVIRRFLDQAAFKAGQEDAGVVMVGRLRPDTVSALLLWGLQDRANRVALAPVSAILRGEQ